MIIAIVLVVLFGAAVYGHFLIKKERRKQLERRQERVKIAEGIFDDKPVEPEKKKKSWTKKKKEVEPPPLVSEKVAEDLAKLLPYGIERALTERKTYSVAHAASAVAASDYGRRKTKLLRSVYLPSDEPASAMAGWLTQLVGNHRQVEEAAAIHFAREKDAESSFFRLRSARDSLASAGKMVEFSDRSNLSDEMNTWIEVAKRLAPEISVSEHVRSLINSRDKNAPNVIEADENVKLQQKDLLIRDLSLLLLSSLQIAMTGAEPLVKQRKAAEGALAKLVSLEKAGNFDKPDKPTDQDVQNYLQSILEWRQAIEESRRDLHEHRLLLRACLDDYAPLIKMAQQAQYEAEGVALDGNKWQRSAELKAAVCCLPQLIALYEQANLALPTSMRDPEPLEEVDGGTPIAEAQVSADALPPEKPVAIVHLDREQEEAYLGSLRAAMRKLGFAVAQARAANAKVDASKAQPELVLSHDAPKLDEASVEQYVRKHALWTKAIVQKDAANQTRVEKTQAAFEQFRQRDVQVPQAAETLRTALHELFVGHTVSRQTGFYLEVAAWLVNHYLPQGQQIALTVAPPPPPPPPPVALPPRVFPRPSLTYI